MTENMIQIVKRIETEENTFVLRAAVNEDNEFLILCCNVVSQTDCRYYINKYSFEGEFSGQTAALGSRSRAHDTMDAQMKLWGYREENPVLQDTPSS